jgi:hypothetical protein
VPKSPLPRTDGRGIINRRAAILFAPQRITRLSQEDVMANKDQSKSKAKTNAPKLTAKQKKEKKAKKAAARDSQQ